MRMIIHDLDQQEFSSLNLKLDSNTTVISDNGRILHCIGCFGCWIKTPGRCVLKDDYQNMGELLSKCEEVIIVSKCLYGSYSPFIRNVLDRSISYLLPYFQKVNGETHHRKRYIHTFSLVVHFYGSDLTEPEKSTAKALVEANSANLYSTENQVYFHKDLQSVREVFQ